MESDGVKEKGKRVGEGGKEVWETDGGVIDATSRVRGRGG